MSGMLGAWTFSWSSNSTSVGEPRPEATAWRASHVTGRPIARSPPHLRGKPPRCGHRAPRCRRWSYASQMPRSEHPLATQPLLIILSWSFLPSSYPVHAEICFSSSVKRNAPNAIECSWMQFMNSELQYFVLCLPFAAKSIPLRAHSRCPIRMPWRICPLITAQTTSWAWILNTWIMVPNIKFFHENHDIFHIFRVDPGICRSSPFQESKCHQMFIWQKQPWLNLPHIIPHKTWYII